MKKQGSIKINANQTRDRIRAKYGSVRKFAGICQREYGLKNLHTAYRTVHNAVTGATGQFRKGPSASILARLKAEGLLVIEDDDESPGRVVND